MVLPWTLARCVHTERIAVRCSSLSVVAELRPTLAKKRVLKIAANTRRLCWIARGGRA